MSWRCLAFSGTRQRWCLAGSDAAAHHTYFCAHCCYFSLPRHYRASYLLVPRKTSAVAAAVAPALVSGNLFLSPPCLWSAKKEPSCSAFHCWFLWEGLEKPQVGCLSFLWEKRSLFNWKKETQLETFPCSLALCELKNLKIFMLTIFRAFLCCLAGLRAAKGVSLPITHCRAIHEAKPIFQASHLFAETVQSATEYTQKRSYRAF